MIPELKCPGRVLFAYLKPTYCKTALFGYQKTLKLGCVVDGWATFVLTIIFISIQIFPNCKTYKDNSTVILTRNFLYATNDSQKLENGGKLRTWDDELGRLKFLDVISRKGVTSNYLKSFCSFQFSQWKWNFDRHHLGLWTAIFT